MRPECGSRRNRPAEGSGFDMRKLAVAALLLVSFPFFSVSRLNALDRTAAQGPKHGHLAIATKSRWVPMYGDSHFKIADNMIATLFVEKGSLVEYKRTGVWPQSSSFLLRLKQTPVTDDSAETHRTLVVDIAYKNNPETQQWESYAVSWKYDAADVKKPARRSQSRGIKPGCSARPADEAQPNGEFL